MDVPVIKDEGQLGAWLNTRSQQESIVIAHRVAMRVAPLWIDEVRFAPIDGNSNEIAFFRALLISGAASFSSKPEMKKSSAAAAHYSSIPSSSFMGAALSVDAAESAASVGASIKHPAARAALAADQAYRAAKYAKVDHIAAFALWDDMHADLSKAISVVYLLGLPIWQQERFPFADEWKHARAAIVARGSDWDFWMRWYDAALLGQPLNWKMQEEIALLPTEVWEGDVSALAAAIAAIELKYALDATYNGEIIAINPATGKLYLEPDTELPADIATYANRKLRKAIDLFGDSPANQYTALGPELKLLTDTLADASNLPVEIFDACASVSRRVIARAENGECPLPETDALVADFLTRVRDVGADILGNDPKTQQILFKRHSIKGNSSLIRGRSVVMTAAGLISAQSEGYLATAIIQNAEIASDESSHPEEQAIATYKLASRVFNIQNLVIAGAALSPASLALQTQGLHYLTTSPEVVQVIDWFLKLLNL